MRLRTVAVPFAINATRTNRDLRLDDVVTGTCRVAIGIQEGQNTIFLMRLGQEQIPGRRAQ